MKTHAARAILGIALLTTTAACRGDRQAPAPPPGSAPATSAQAPARPPLPWKAAAIAHAGAGTPPERSDGCRAAVDAALAALERGADPASAAVAGVVVLEDDPRFNAGTGSRVRIDGQTVQMDASVMTSEGRFGAVAAIEDVPIHGAGLYASPRGASAATGTGERIVEAMLAREVDGWLAGGATPAEAARRAVEAVKQRKGDVGIIVIGPDAMAADAGLPMAWAAREAGSSAWMGP